MSDPGFREIHLSGKHVVFLFMAGAVAAVGIFLLGVTVGKGITQPEPASSQAAASPTTSPDSTASGAPESTKPSPNELQAYRTLQEKGSPTPSPSPSQTPAAATPSPTPNPPPPAASPKPSPSPAAAKTSAGGTLYVLVDSFSSARNANTRVAELKKKGFDAVVFNDRTSKAPYKVRLGPYDKAAAEAMAERLRKEGYKPFVIR